VVLNGEASEYISVFKIFRLPDGYSIYSAEAFAIYKALLYIKESDFKNYIILTDALNILEDLKFGRESTSKNPCLLRKILDLLRETELSALIWIPSHCNIKHHDSADRLAKQATAYDCTEDLTYSLHDYNRLVESLIWEMWIKSWNEDKGCSYQNHFQPTANGVMFKQTSRRCETMLSRLRMGQTRLNSGLYRIGRHVSGLCNICQVPETTEHFLLYCISTESLQLQLTKIFEKLKVEMNISSILTVDEAQDTIVRYVKINEINV